jgi:hypothetical protein
LLTAAALKALARLAWRHMMRFTKTKIALALVAGLVAAAPAAPAAADPAAAIASGFGGLALGTVLGTTLARPQPQTVYVERPQRVYVEERCWFERRRVYDEDGYFAGYRRRRVCD